MDTDADHKVVTETDPAKRDAQVVDTWQLKRTRMKSVCANCHTSNYVNAFYKQYDDFIVNYNEKFAKPGTAIMKLLLDKGLRTKPDFDEEIEWTRFYLWHHEGRRARHGASMMAPDYTHWHGMYEVADRFYMEFIPDAQEIANHAIEQGKKEQGDAVLAVIEGILARQEHKWFIEQRSIREAAKAAEADHKDEEKKKEIESWLLKASRIRRGPGGMRLFPSQTKNLSFRHIDRFHLTAHRP
jgi:hypothetical protein